MEFDRSLRYPNTRDGKNTASLNADGTVMMCPIAKSILTMMTSEDR